LIPSCSAPPVLTGGLTIPRWLPHPLRRAFWRALDAVGHLLAGRPLNRLRARLGLPPVWRLFRWWLSPDLVIGLFPPWFAAPQPDWPPKLRLAGFGRYDGARAELPEAVRAFCRAGPMPVAFTLGTGMAHAAGFFRNAVAACRAAGVRGILLTRHPGLIPPLPPTIFHCPFAPFRQLLPLCGAVAHHGGVGTTAAALEAGCPQVVLPLAWDQPDNAARVQHLGVGVTLGRWHRGSEHLARAIAQIGTPGVRDRCQEVAALARQGDGLAVAADWVEGMA
jgi:UDP:flavonoid glycosyltransferase YjiC (YdhE family)